MDSPSLLFRLRAFCFAYYFPIPITPSTCTDLLTAYLPWLTLPVVLRCLRLSYPYYSSIVCSFANYRTLPSWFLLPHVPLCFPLSYPDNSSHMCIFAYCFRTVPWLILPRVQLSLHGSYPSYSSSVVSFAHNFRPTTLTSSSYAASLKIFLPWFLLSLLLCLQLSYPDYFSHTWRFAYCFPTLTNPLSCAALLTTFLTHITILSCAKSPTTFLVCSFALRSFPGYSSHLCSFAYYVPMYPD